MIIFNAKALPDTLVEVVASRGVAGGRDDGEQGRQGEDEAVDRHDVFRDLLIFKFATRKIHGI